MADGPRVVQAAQGRERTEKEKGRELNRGRHRETAEDRPRT